MEKAVIPNNIKVSSRVFLVLADIDWPWLTRKEEEEKSKFEHVTTQEEEVDIESSTWFETEIIRDKTNNALYGITIERNLYTDVEEFSKDFVELSLMHPTTKVVYEYVKDKNSEEPISV